MVQTSLKWPRNPCLPATGICEPKVTKQTWWLTKQLEFFSTIFFPLSPLHQQHTVPWKIFLWSLATEPSSHQRNSQSPNTANYCSCWQIQSQNRTTSCQLHAPTTVTPPTEADSKVLSQLYLHHRACVSFLRFQSCRKQKEIQPKVQFLPVLW